MASNLERIRKAYEETRRLYGIPEEKVKAALKKLLNFYGNAWGIIEKNNYKAIIECVLENNKQGEDEIMVHSKKGVLLIEEGKKLETKMVRILSDDESDEPERSLKRRKRNYNEKALTSAEPSVGTIGDVKRSRPAIPHTVTNANGRALFIKNGNELLNNGEDKGEGNSNKQSSGHEPAGSQDIVSKVRQHEYVDVFNKDVGKSSVKIEKKIIDACNGGNSSSGSERKIDRSSDYHPQCSNSSSVSKNSIFIEDITRGEENEPISLVGDNDGSLELPKFFYISRNIVYNKAYVNFSLARISDHNCCTNCSGDCLSAPANCACTGETRGDFAYTRGGLVEEKFLDECIGMSRRKPNKEHLYYCENCPLENSSLVTNGKQQKRKKSKTACKGHLMRKFIKECWTKCGCSCNCGNRVVQRGITVKLQVFQTPQGKGWGLRTLQDLEKGTFVCEYVGEIVTNLELHERNEETAGGEHTYPVLLDADWASERHLKDEEALCLDATKFGNVARFINHRCYDANLVEIPVEVETPDHHYYHIAFFTSRRIEANEELTWDYGIDFDDETHPIKAFECKCGSLFCGMKNRSSC